MNIQLKFMALILFCCMLAFTACDTKEKVTFIPIGGGGTQHSAGDLIHYTTGGVSFMMIYVPGGWFPTGTGTHTSPDQEGANPQIVSTPYYLGETEVTYELWYTVHTWAIDTTVDHDGNGFNKSADGDDDVYSFANPGREGSVGTITSPGGAAPTDRNKEPVTSINWRDAIVWCNALTEWYNANNGTKRDLDCVYFTDSRYTLPIRTSTNDFTDTNTDGVLDNSLIDGSEDKPYIKASRKGNTDMENCTAKGFRLPTSMEWECAARYIDGVTWTAGNHASGADVVYDATSGGTDRDGDGDIDYSENVAVYHVSSTAAVKSKSPNALSLYDMSGSVFDMCFDWNPDWVGAGRICRGGSWGDIAYYLQVGGVFINCSPFNEAGNLGFRFARTH